jgi:hypothetical protein
MCLTLVGLSQVSGGHGEYRTTSRGLLDEPYGIGGRDEQGMENTSIANPPSIAAEGQAIRTLSE